jgi:hypothetical protein
MDKARGLFEAVTAETIMLQHKQRRNGLDYHFKTGVARPIILNETSMKLVEGTLPVSSAVPVRKLAPRSAGVRESSGPRRATLGGAASARVEHPPALESADSDTGRLSDYDPRKVMMREHRALIESVAQLRSEASRTHHEAERLTLKVREAEAELAKIKNEDAVADEHAAWRLTMRKYKMRTGDLRKQLSDHEVYHSTLQHMLQRCRRDRVLQQSTLAALEDALHVHEREASLHAALLQQVLRSRDVELVELGRVRAETARFLSALDAKLEARRIEVKSRQEKAFRRLAKLEAERLMKSKAEGELSAEGERAMINVAQGLAAAAAALATDKMRTQAAADAAEGLYQHVRFAAGAPGPGPSNLVTAEGEAFEPPDAEAIVARFMALEGDVSAVRITIALKAVFCRVELSRPLRGNPKAL